jgi:pyruvate dehydrogenase E2 component (dihydrolipoamide acetyltransferase)
MPALGVAQTTGVLLRWLKRDGDAVTQGEPLMEVETDKAVTEIEAPASGVLANVTAQPGDEVPVGRVIALILAPGEPLPAPSGANASGPLAVPRVVDKGDGRVLASPKARRLASERGLDLVSIIGSGPGGAVLAADVPSPGAALTASVPTEAAPPLSPPAATVQTLASSASWRVAARRLTESWTTVPHFYVVREANATRLVGWHDHIRNGNVAKITYTDLLVKIAAAALRRHPRLNAVWQDGEILVNNSINVGVAVATDDGLVVPVIHRADQLGLQEIATRRQDLVAKALAGRLPLADVSGGTFTISNLGMYGVDAFTAIINPPQAAILAVSRLADRVVPVAGRPAVQPMITFTLSCDHRALDGARAAQFLQTFTEAVEEPLRLFD